MDVIKIDRSFIGQSVISAHHRMLDKVQGYFHARPMPGEEAGMWLQARAA